ncbi:hypothetical protein ACFXG4_27400 [Nocardia sp. NPDC059246]|uniref:hypothetical protein n=1 Tax=unclassified Nocardia TaxID=2637762 RepID=UPI0036BB5319
MSRPERPAVDPAMQAWIDEQKKKFKPGDLDDAIRLMRGYARTERERARTAPQLTARTA